MHLLQHGTKNKKGYITANAVLLALFVMLIVQITMQNITAVTLQSRLFQATEQDRLDVKSGVYRELSKVVANPAYTSAPYTLTLGNNAKVTVSTVNVGTSTVEKKITSQKITSQKGTLQLVVNVFKTPDNRWIIYSWAWVPCWL